MDSRPDAVKFPTDWKTGADALARLLSVADIAELKLGVDRSAGERAHCKPNYLGDADFVWATRNPADTGLFPKGDPLEGKPRYRWVPQPDGSTLGYLVPEASHAG